jgi:threonyl-tRNA synthetase
MNALGSRVARECHPHSKQHLHTHWGIGVGRQLAAAGLRVAGDYRPEKIGAKIRDAQLDLIPYMLVVGSREMEQGSVAVRHRRQGDLGSMGLEAAVGMFQEEIRQKAIR